MRFDQEIAKEKTQELTDLVNETVSKYWNAIGDNAAVGDDVKATAQIVSNLIRVIPPERVIPQKKEPLILRFVLTRLVIISEGGKGNGSTWKPGNITLNIRKLVEAVAASGLAISTAITVPWTAPFAVIVVLGKIRSNIRAELSEREAAIIWTMWLNRDENNCVSHAGLLDMVNSELTKYRRSVISPEELEDSLQILNRMKCIKPSKSAPLKWRLCERVKVNFK